MKKYRTAILAVLLALDVYFVYRLNVLATVLLMAYSMITAVWLFIYAPRVWRSYKARYRRATPSQKRRLGKPNISYYYLNRYVVAPLFFGTGILCAYLAWRLSH